MTLDYKEFGKFKILQDDGNWIDRKRFEPVVDYWSRYFSTMRVKSGAIIREIGAQPNVDFDVDPKKIVIKGHTCINTLAIFFAATKCGHTLYFDNANNLTKAWYKKVKPDIVMVGDDDLCLEGGRYTSGEGAVRLLFTRRFTALENPYTYDERSVKQASKDNVIVEHRDTKLHKYKISEIDDLIKRLMVKKTDDGDEVEIDPPGVAYIEQDTRNQVSQLIKYILPLMYAGSKIVLDTGLTSHNLRKSLTENKPDLVYWGLDVKKMIDDKDKFIRDMSPAPLFVPHIRKEKKVDKEALLDLEPSNT
jgi:hypothetical protein